MAVFCFSVAPLGIKLAHDSSFLASIAHRLMRRRHAGGKRKPRRSGRTRLRFVDEDGGAFDYLGVIFKPPDRLSCTPATGFPSLDLVRFQQDELVDLHLAQVLQVKERDGYYVLPFGRFTMARFRPASRGRVRLAPTSCEPW